VLHYINPSTLKTQGCKDDNAVVVGHVVVEGYVNVDVMILIGYSGVVIFPCCC
jgi:hypothetical protein